MYETMSLVELKQCAKAKRIKQYYVMKRAQLIQLLSLPELPTPMVREKMTVKQLREEAKRRGLTHFWLLNRAALLKELFPEDPRETAPDKDKKNQSNADKHDEPENHDSEQIRIEETHDG
jgi:hypothetical protein